MTIDEFCRLRPCLYHVTTIGALEQIRKYGLLSTAEILALIDYEGDELERLFSKQRMSSEVVSHPVHGSFTLRDQLPLSTKNLQKCLSDMSAREWYETLNSKVFFWVRKNRLDNLLSAKVNRRQDQFVFTLDSKKLLNAYFEKARVSFINTGYALRRPAPRGSNSFVPLSECPRSHLSKVVELTVEGRVSEIETFALPSYRRASMVCGLNAG